MRSRYLIFSALWGIATFSMLYFIGYKSGVERAFAITISIIFSGVLFRIFENYLKGKTEQMIKIVKKSQDRLYSQYGGRVLLESLFCNNNNIVVAYILKKEREKNELEENEIATFLCHAFRHFNEKGKIVVTSVVSFSDIPRARDIIKNASL